MSSRFAQNRPGESPLKTATRSLKPKASSSSIGTSSRAKSPVKAFPGDLHVNDGPSTSAHLSIRDAIALKRAEAKKTKGSKTATLGSFEAKGSEDALPSSNQAQDDDDILGRGSLREVIEKGKSTGSVNLAARSLPCIPSGLFELHLGITPDTLKSVHQEPPLPSAESQPPSKRRGGRDVPAWYDSKDLVVLKAPNNDIEEIQHEISMFGSLKTVDLHKNRIHTIPDTFADLTALTHLDLSHNALTTLPKNIFSLPELVNLNVSHNELVSLPFSLPFVNAPGSRSRANQSTGSFFMPSITRATSPLPRLATLDASHNRITGDAVDVSLPSSIVNFDLSYNPLSSVKADLLNVLGALSKLKELRLKKTDLSDAIFPNKPFPASSFPALRVIDFGETQVSVDAAEKAFAGLGKQLFYELTREEPPVGVLQVIVGKKVLREAWEIDIEQRTRPKVKTQGLDDTTASLSPAPAVEAIKEAWEIEAEQGLLTEGGRRRARAAAAVEASVPDATKESTKSPSPTSPAKSSASALSNAQYYNPSTQTLTLPPSFPPTKSPGHSRTFSAAFTSAVRTQGRTAGSSDVLVPAATLPLSVIAPLPLAQTLKVLTLNKRRLDRSFDIPAGEIMEVCLPCLEELSLSGCELEDSIQVTRTAADSPSSLPARNGEPLLPLITKLFPSLRILDLSYNCLSDASFSSDTLAHLLLSDPSAAPPRKGLSHLRLQGNKISHLDGFTEIAEQFKGNRDVPTWKMEELDVRDNELAKLPPTLGLLPLDVFLVDGNLFRVPQRRVWEREGTKGLLSWLRGRIE
ncbi:hypothetical protein ONZ45_g6091 [Pleurotus djamor]|nr:hypothetical protein ONZ45_g6091 [Pleurotus djamor]